MTDSAPRSADPLPLSRTVIGRWLLPFSLAPKFPPDDEIDLDQVLGHVTNHSLVKDQSESACRWKLAQQPDEPMVGGAQSKIDLHRQYVHDLLPEVRAFLFGGEAPVGAVCLKIESSAANDYFQKLSLGLDLPDATGDRPAKPRFAAKLFDDSGLELFLSRIGIGVLSISLEIELAGTETWRELDDLLHAIVTDQVPVWLWRAAYSPTGSPEALPAADRVPNSRAALTWREWEAWLLEPLAQRWRIDLVERRLVNVVLPLHETDDFGSAELRQRVLTRLSRMAQVHSKSHPGELPGEEQAGSMIVGRNHMVAVAMGGAAHAVLSQTPRAVADEPELESKHSYDREHVRRAHFNYFSVWLLAIIQRQSLGALTQRTLRHLQNQASTSGELSRTLERLSRCYRALGLAGDFVQVSWRQSMQDFHDLVQQATHTQVAFQQARQAVENWERSEQRRLTSVQTRQQVELLESQREMLEAQQRAETNLEWLEVFIFGVYVVELAHIISDGVFAHGPVLSQSLAALAIVSIVFAYFWVRPGHGAQPFSWIATGKPLFFLALAILPLAGFWLFNLYFNVPH